MLGQLAYAAPQILRDLADLVMPGRGRPGDPRSGLRHRPGGRWRSSPLAARLDGIDLSPAMIEKARARGIYDHLAGRRSGNRAGGAGPGL